MSGLPREILKWMQSLDLSYSVKNVKRDFANGFLVAEILSRYYKSDITMHSFDNGIGLVKRIQNWSLLEKFFKKVQFPIERSVIDAVIHCKTGAAIPLMEQLYTLLTHKTIQSSRPVKDLENIPAFARPTASQLIKERMQHDPDLLGQGSVVDQSLAPSRAQAVLEKHMQRLALEKQQDPGRFQPKNSPGQAGRKAAGLGGSPTQPVQFKEVQVRQVDDRGGVLSLRANHVYHQPQAANSWGSHTSQSQSPPVQPYGSSTQAPVSPSPAIPAAASNTDSRPGLTILSQALSGLLGGEDSPLIQQVKEASSKQELSLAYADFVAASFSSQSSSSSSNASSWPDTQHASILHALHGQTAGFLVDLSIANPKEFWLLAGWLFSLLKSFPAHSQAFYQTLSFFSGLGLRLVERDSHLSTQLFLDFAFQRYLTLLKEQPAKIFQMAKLVYTFVRDDADEHAGVLEQVRTQLGLSSSGGQGTEEINVRIFYSILAALAPFEGALLIANDSKLLNLYLKFVSEGIQPRNTARVRAVALSILAPLSANPNYGVEVLKPILEKVRPLLPSAQGSKRVEESKNSSESTSTGPLGTGRGRSNNEWTIDAELLHVLACVLNHAWFSSGEEDAVQAQKEILSWISLLLSPDTTGCTYTLLAGLAHLVHVLGQQPSLRKLWLQALDVHGANGRTGAILRGEAISEDADAQQEERQLNVAPSAPAASNSSSDLTALFIPPLRSVWHPLTIAQTLGDSVRVQKLDNLSQGHVELLSAATEDAFGSLEHPTPFVDSEAAEWCDLFLQLRDHLVVELCDASLSESVIGILRRFLLDPRTTQTAQSLFLPNESSTSGSDNTPAPPPLYCIFKFIFPQATEESQINLAGFLEELAQIPTFIALVHKNIQVFSETEPERFAESPLVGLLQKLDQQAAQAQGQTQR